MVDPALLSPTTAAADPALLLKYALEAVERAGIAIEEGPPSVRLLIEIGEILYIQGSWDEAAERFEQAASLAAKKGYAEGQARALRQTGRPYRRRGDWARAETALKKAITLYRKTGDTAGETEALLQSGNIRFEQGRYEDAEKTLRKALKAGEKSKSDRLTGDIVLSLGVIRHVKGQDEDAIDRFTESLAHFETLGDTRRIGQACHNLGIAYAGQGKWDRAGLMYERALEIARQNGDWAMVGVIYLYRGEMQANLSDVTMAMGYAQRALEIFERLRDPLGQADTYRLLGRIAGLKTAWTLAEDLLDESERLQQQHGSRLGLAEVDEFRAWVYERQRDPHRALELYGRTLTAYEELQTLQNVRRVREAIQHFQET